MIYSLVIFTLLIQVLYQYTKIMYLDMYRTRIQQSYTKSMYRDMYRVRIQRSYTKAMYLDMYRVRIQRSYTKAMYSDMFRARIQQSYIIFGPISCSLQSSSFPKTEYTKMKLLCNHDTHIYLKDKNDQRRNENEQMVTKRDLCYS